MTAREQPGRVFVGEAPAPKHHRQDSINVDQRISSYIMDMTDGRTKAPGAVIQQADLLRKVMVSICDSMSKLLESYTLTIHPTVVVHCQALRDTYHHYTIIHTTHYIVMPYECAHYDKYSLFSAVVTGVLATKRLSSSCC